MCVSQDKLKAKNVKWMIEWHTKEMIADNSIQIHSNKVCRPSACTAHDAKMAKTEPVAEDRTLKFPELKYFLWASCNINK